jgi:hypothetical protein
MRRFKRARFVETLPEVGGKDEPGGAQVVIEEDAPIALGELLEDRIARSSLRAPGRSASKPLPRRV